MLAHGKRSQQIGDSGRSQKIKRFGYVRCVRGRWRVRSEIPRPYLLLDFNHPILERDSTSVLRAASDQVDQ